MAQRDLQLRSVAAGGLGLSRRAAVGGLAAAGLVAGQRSARAQLRVDITKGNVEPIPIAVSAFAGDTPVEQERGRQVAQLVSSDLDSSGLFRTIDPRAYLQSPDQLRAAPRFADWRQINAQALIAGSARATSPGSFATEFRLWDVFAGTQLKGLLLQTTDANWRRVGHRIADQAYERLTGESGYFDTRIAYIAESGPETRRVKRVAIMDQDGANHSFLTDGQNLVLTPEFAPDATQLAYLVFRTAPHVFLRDLASGRESLLGDFPGMTFSPRFAPDGRSMLLTMAESGNSDIYRMDLATRRATRLTDSPAIDTSPSFSPDAGQIVFNSDRGGSPQLYVMPASGGTGKRISFGPGRYGSPAWSPRGDLIAFIKIKDGMFGVGVMKPDGSDERMLTRSFQDESPSWAPNGRIILYAHSEVGGRSRLRTIDITGYNGRELATPLDASDPDWSRLIP